MPTSVAAGIVVTAKEGGYTKLKGVVTKERKAVNSNVMGVFSAAIANSSAAKFVPPPPKDKFGFLVKPKTTRGPGEAFIGRADPKWLSKIYENYKHYARKIPDPKTQEKNKTFGQLQDELYKSRLKINKKKSAKGGGKTTSSSDTYKFGSVSKQQFKKMTQMPALPYQGPNGRILMGALPPNTYINHNTPHSVTRKENHVITYKNTPGANKLAKTVQSGDIESVRNLIYSGLCSVHSVSRLGEPLLSIAARHANPLMVAFLLSAGADRGILDEKGQTAFDAVERCINANSIGYHPKMMGWKECRALLSTESIFTAAKKGNVTRLRWLLKNKQASVNSRNPYGMTALHIAALHNQRESIKFLCSMGADPNLKNDILQDCYDMTPVLALHRIMDAEKRKAERRQISQKLASLKKTKEFETTREELRKKKEWTKGTTAAKEIFAKYKKYEATDSDDFKSIAKLPKPDITYHNKQRFSHGFFAGSGIHADDIDHDFHVRIWPSPEHAKFRHWFRATFG